MKKAYFAGGCFWCIAAAFTSLTGVTDVTEGYSGGDTANPTYLQVKQQLTTHREAICVTYDEKVLSFAQLVDFFFQNVDPFDADGQFVDRGFSYTLAIFFQTDAELQICQEKIAQLEGQFGQKVCVTLAAYKNFFVAEEEHQDYAQKNQQAFAEELELSGRNKFFKK